MLKAADKKFLIFYSKISYPKKKQNVLFLNLKIFLLPLHNPVVAEKGGAAQVRGIAASDLVICLVISPPWWSGRGLRQRHAHLTPWNLSPTWDPKKAALINTRKKSD